MAEVNIQIASRTYPVACRDGEEARLHEVASLVDAKARSATDALGNMSEARTLLFASLMLADGIVEGTGAAGVGGGASPPTAAVDPSAVDPAVIDALERIASRIESVADALENGAADA